MNDLFEKLGCSPASLTLLLEMIGTSPLSIEIAAAYIRETAQQIPTYLNLCRAHKQELRRFMSVTDDFYLSVAVTVLLSLREIEKTEGSRLLCLLAFMGPDEIPLWVFTADPRFQDRQLREMFSSRERLHHVLQPLDKFGLIHRWNGSLSMNRLVQRIVRDIIENNNMSDVITNESPTYWIERAIELIHISYPMGLLARVESPKVFELLYPHAAQVILHAESYNIANMELGMVQSSTGLYWLVLDLPWAVQILQRALKKVETAFGVGHINSSQMIVNITDVLLIQQKHNDAIKEKTRLLKIIEEAFGFDHIALISSINHFAFILGFAKAYEDEIFQYRWVIKICERRYGAFCAKTRDAINRLALTYLHLGRHMDAIREWERAVDSVQGPPEDIPSDVMMMMKNIADAFQSQNKIDEVPIIENQSRFKPIVDAKQMKQLRRERKRRKLAMEAMDRLSKPMAPPPVPKKSRAELLEQLRQIQAAKKLQMSKTAEVESTPKERVVEKEFISPPAPSTTKTEYTHTHSTRT